MKRDIAIFGLIAVGLFAIGQTATNPELSKKSRSTLESFGETDCNSSGLTTVAEIDLTKLTNGAYISFELCNTGASDTFSNVSIDRKIHPDGSWRAWISDTDFETATSNLVFAEDVQQLAPAACGDFDIVPRGAAAVRLRVQSATETGTPQATVWANVSNSN